MITNIRSFNLLRWGLGLVAVWAVLGCQRYKNQPVPVSSPVAARAAYKGTTHQGYRLHNAIRRGDNERQILSLLSQGYDIMQKDPDGQTPLALSVQFGRQRISQLLQAMGAKLDASVCSWKIETTRTEHQNKSVQAREYEQEKEVASLQTYEQSLQQQQQGLTPVLESKEARVTLIGFFDFQSPESLRLAKVLKEVLTRYKEKIRLVFKHYPSILNQDAYLAAQASMAAHAQGKFWPYHDVLFANQKNLKAKDLLRYAQKLKLSMNSFKKDMYHWKYKAQIDADFRLGTELSRSGYSYQRPSLFINGQRAYSIEYMQLVEQIDRLLAQPNTKAWVAGVVVWSALGSQSKWFGYSPNTSSSGGRYGRGGTYRSSPYRSSYRPSGTYRTYRTYRTVYRRR